jgi:hypothetical protein
MLALKMAHKTNIWLLCIH